MSLNALRFAAFKVPNQVFYQSTLSAGIVNLKPLVPGPPTPEVSDLFLSVHQVSKVIETEYKAQALNIALQDGPLAGQSVPHVHVHIIPRRAKDFEPLDEMYNALDAQDLSSDFAEAYASRPTRAERKAFEAEQRERERGNVETPFKGIEDERRARTSEEMREEAQRLSRLFPDENRGVFDEAE
ncbi:SPOSA6832_00707, partial [Sporobolomyces salmonicolor]